jgi:hypothetical protein
MPTFNPINLDDEYSLRVLDPKDFDELLPLCHEFHQISPWKGLPFKVEWAESVINDTNSLVIGLFYKGTIVGFIAGTKYEHPMFATLFSNEYACYVQPEHRKKHSNELIQMYEAWAKYHECKYVTLTNMGTKKLNPVYEKMGYNLVEQFFIKELR